MKSKSPSFVPFASPEIDDSEINDSYVYNEAKQMLIEHLSGIASYDNEGYIKAEYRSFKFIDGLEKYVVKYDAGLKYMKRCRIHREDGSAAICNNGTMSWRIEGKRLTKEKFKQWQKDNLK